MGAKKQPTYRFVGGGRALAARRPLPRDSRALQPAHRAQDLVVDQDKVKEWLAKGAQPSDPVRRLFAELGLVERGPIPENKRAPKAKKS